MRVLVVGILVILFDEFMGNLDFDIVCDIMMCFKDFVYKEKWCVIMVIYSREIVYMVDIVL